MHVIVIFHWLHDVPWPDKFIYLNQVNIQNKNKR